MQNERIISQATSYWAAHLGCSAASLFAQPLHIVTHGADLADYDGIFALFRCGAATASFPPGCVESLRHLLPSLPVTPDRFADAFSPLSFTVIGPAYIGYADVETEWEHGGSVVGEQPSSGVFVGSDLVALAGYEVWGGAIAHISVITHPASRGLGFGRSAVAHLASTALAAQLVPQYRTLESNRASIRIAESLGFTNYATSVAVRLNRAA